MGGWQLEVGKMAMYMSFPVRINNKNTNQSILIDLKLITQVAMFHWFNQPAYFEKWVTETKRQLYPPESESHRNEIEKSIRDLREKHDNEMMAEMKKL